MMNEIIRENIEKIRYNIASAAKRAGRDLSEITLIGVSKTVDVDRINAAVLCGVTNLGENRVQELLDKYDKIEGVGWHLIGHLQTNKVKYIADKVELIHSVDSARLADEIDLRARSCGRCVDVLLQVNVSGEESKFGVEPKAVFSLAEHVSALENVRLRGLMTVPPKAAVPSDNKRYFNELSELSAKIAAEGFDNIKMDTLSMGMSGDYAEAIECGATMVRVGSAMFGDRVYNQK